MGAGIYKQDRWWDNFPKGAAAAETAILCFGVI